MEKIGHKHINKNPLSDDNICNCGAKICFSASPDNAMNCHLEKGHKGKCFDPWYPEYGKWVKPKQRKMTKQNN